VKIEYTSGFNKNFKTRIQEDLYLLKRFRERLNLFTHSPDDPSLRDHALKENKQGLRAFSITPDIRVVYFIREGAAIFIDIGTHKQVY
jgi:addiction module RelE/StbE family toxin